VSGRRLAAPHPGLILAALDVAGLLIAGYLASVELADQLPYCGVLHGCQEVALSPYSRVAGIPVAVFGVILSSALLTLALLWWRGGQRFLLAAHYGLSLAGVVFEGYFTFLELFVIHAICVWCVAYGVSLLLRFLVTAAIWRRSRVPAMEPEP